jgi:hypothetical protein
MTPHGRNHDASLKKTPRSRQATPAQISELLAENIVFNSPILARLIEAPLLSATL